MSFDFKVPNYEEIISQQKSYEWHHFLCEYYDVTPDQALELGTRKFGRKPALPGSKTCDPVSDMTFEDIWELQERETPEQIFQFYKDQGAWSTFRQTVRHLELAGMHRSVLQIMASPGMHLCEYGCGVAPFSTTLLLNCGQDFNVDISISDVEGSEHLHFAEWKLKKIIEERELRNVNLYVKPVIVDKLPEYHRPIDRFIIFEVLEHVLSPVETITNILKQMNTGALYLENFVKLNMDEMDDPGPDLKSATSERSRYYNLVESSFNLLTSNPDHLDPNGTRIWVKN